MCDAFVSRMLRHCSLNAAIKWNNVTVVVAFLTHEKERKYELIPPVKISHHYCRCSISTLTLNPDIDVVRSSKLTIEAVCINIKSKAEAWSLL